MFPFLLAAFAVMLAAVLLYVRKSGAEEVSPPQAAESCRKPMEGLHIVEMLAETIRVLAEVMEHQELGGPGFLLVQFSSRTAEGHITVTAQYPNIREGLYRRIVRRELDRDMLAAAGVPEALLSRNPDFETESGGVVLISVQVGEIPPAMEEALDSRRERSILLTELAELLRERFPRFSVRPLGAELLLSPVREDTDAHAG